MNTITTYTLPSISNLCFRHDYVTDRPGTCSGIVMSVCVWLMACDAMPDGVGRVSVRCSEPRLLIIGARSMTWCDPTESHPSLSFSLPLILPALLPPWCIDSQWPTHSADPRMPCRISKNTPPSIGHCSRTDWSAETHRRRHVAAYRAWKLSADGCIGIQIITGGKCRSVGFRVRCLSGRSIGPAARFPAICSALRTAPSAVCASPPRPRLGC